MENNRYLSPQPCRIGQWGWSLAARKNKTFILRNCCLGNLTRPRRVFGELMPRLQKRSRREIRGAVPKTGPRRTLQAALQGARCRPAAALPRFGCRAPAGTGNRKQKCEPLTQKVLPMY